MRIEIDPADLLRGACVQSGAAAPVNELRHGGGPISGRRAGFGADTLPPDLRSAIQTAAQTPDRLAAQDRALHFASNQATGKVTVEVHDLRGNVLFTIPALRALEIAAGADLNE